MIGAPDARGAFASDINRPGRGLDVWLLASMGVLILIGLALMHSIDMSRQSGYMVKQAVFAAVGVVVLLVVAAAKPDRLERFAPALYGLSLTGLAAVLVLGKNVKGATRWIDLGPIQFQPSEVAKVILIVTLSTYYARRWDQTHELKTYIGSIAHVAPIVVLVLMQPHLAGAMSLIVTWLAISLYARVPWKFVFATMLAIAALGAFAWFTPRVMPAYMRERIEAKLNPDPKGNAYQQERAKIAFGVGGAFGVGYGKGEQKAARNIPEQQNDFIFTVVGEEGGLVGGILVLGAFLFFFTRVWLVGYRAAEPFGQMASAGVLAVLGFHTLINLGMNVGVLPVAGLWLPFLSYGGTALWMCMACVGLLVGVK